MKEALLFDDLLTDLVEDLDGPPTHDRGRPPIPTSQLAWQAIKKLYTGKSQRRNQGEITIAYQQGFLSHEPRHNATSDFLNRPSTDAILRVLVRKSASPLSGIEDDFAIDSTGFACGAYGTYLQTKYSDKSRKRKFVKLHACVGVHYNVITDARTSPGNANDSPFFRELVQGTNELFDIRNVTADKAYSSLANHGFVDDIGGRAIIPFKSNSTSRVHSGEGAHKRPWRRAYHFFMLHRDEFEKIYHKRSNAESTFAGMKLTLGERLKSKSPRAQRNEVLCKVIVWNIRCVVRAMTEAGVEPLFTAPNSCAQADTG